MDTHGIAIIGMSGRFPGAQNVEEFWRNLAGGVESISFFTDEELTAAGLNVAEIRKDSSNVAARGVVKDPEWLDAAFFNISAKEAEVMDPQQRLFLEASWEVLENAGYDPARIKGYVGVYAGMSSNTYYWNNVHAHPEAMKAVGRIATLGDFLATRVAYKLNLKGPAMTLYTACSTSLVAICQACQALFGYQCDIALAGGVSLSFPQKRVYTGDGGMMSSDGHVRPFDEKAVGTNFSDGLGVVALKRLDEAIADGDQIYAVIKGFGMNNDGSGKAGFAAPSVEGQAEVITLAQAHAGFEPDTISYIEAHGTATPLGDPIEIEALTQAFRAGTAAKNFCAIGSVKGNIGHADAAAGVVGVMKTALALQHRQIPPTVHFFKPNPKIDFANSPFHVSAKLAEWKEGATPRRAGVSGFGVGGTNAHVVLEEAPVLEQSGPSREYQLLLLSARTAAALDAATVRLGDHLKNNPDLNLADAAFTLQMGRRVFEHRRMLVCRTPDDAARQLAAGRLATQQGKVKDRPFIFMFPGKGAKYTKIGEELYRTEPVFRQEVDRCAAILHRPRVLTPSRGHENEALFVFEYALAKLWMAWGIQPSQMIGQGVGELVANCLAETSSLEDSLDGLARFSGKGDLPTEALAEVLQDSEAILLEVGPGHTLAEAARQHPAKGAGHTVISSISEDEERAGLLPALGQIWLAGNAVDWPAFYADEKRRRVTLPTYPFEKKRFWIEPARTATTVTQPPADATLANGATEETLRSPATTTAAPEKKTLFSRRERILAELTEQFQQLSGTSLTEAGPAATFMEMGLDSLFLVQASNTVEKRYGVKVTFRELLEDKTTLPDLAAFIDRELAPDALPAAASPADAARPEALTLEGLQAQIEVLTKEVEWLRRNGPGAPSAISTKPPALLPHTAGATAELSFAQERLWFLDQLDPGGAYYNIPICMRLRGPLDAAVLQACVNQIVRRHQTLRTRFTLVDDAPRQIVDESTPAEISFVDLSSLSERQREAEAAHICAEEAQAPFDLEHGPVFRTKLIRLNVDEHLFAIVVHHIASDGWSNRVLLRELKALYQAYRHSQPSPLPDLAVQYADFAVWQRRWLQGPVLDQQVSYWKKQLEGAPALLELPTDRPRPAQQLYHGGVARAELPTSLVLSLRELSRSSGATLFMTLLAAFQVLMRRYTGCEDIMIGSPISGRDLPEVENLIGFFVNTLVLRGDLSGNPDFRTLVQRTRKTALDAYTHQEVPFEKVVEVLRPERDMSHSPLFQVMLVFQNAANDAGWLDDLEILGEPISTGASVFDLTLFVREMGDELKLGVEYSTDLFDGSRINRMLGHYQRLLEAIVAEPGRPVADLPLLTEPEQKQILFDWNETYLSFPQDKLLSDLVEEQARRRPDETAVVFGGKQLTYRQLDERSNQLGHHLQKLGVGPDSLVAVCVERSLDMVVGLLGVLKAGGAYVPLDPRYPKDRLAFVLEDADAKVLLTQSSLLDSMPASQAKMVQLDADWPTIARESTAKPKSATNPEHLAYVIYTSGSTGLPKGVEIPHRAAVNFMASMQQKPGLKENDVLVAVTTISFDIAGLELFLPLVTGARVVVLSRDEAADGYVLAQQLQVHQATILQATPATWRMLLETKWAGDRKLKMLCGGEPLPRDLADELLAKGGELWNMYGPTETTIWSSCSLVERGDAPITIGLPIANTQLYILDPQLQPVPVGVPGELHIGGKGLARGYHHRAELTAQKFIADPFSKDGRLYKTGDLARFLPDGRVDCLGRLDHQVKIRGFRVELGEIEQVLNQHPQVQASAVIVREDIPGDKRLTAYLVTRNGAPNPAELREALRVKLPDYMVPAAFVPLPKLPQTPNGKLDRKALPKPDFVAPDHIRFVAPTTPTEIAVAEIWSEALHVPRVGVNDDFFELGGHSLLAVRIFTEIRKRFKTTFGLSVLFEARTVGALARLIDQSAAPSPAAQTPARTHRLVPIRSGKSAAALFLVHDILGGGLRYEHIARHFSQDQAIYGIESCGLSGLPIDYSIEEMARNYVRAIRERQPRGPYYLVGHCFGGLIVYEMARQLAAMNEPVGLVGLLDTYQKDKTEVGTTQRAVEKRMARSRFKAEIAMTLSSMWRDPLAHLRAKKTLLPTRLHRRVHVLAYKLFFRLGWKVPSFLENVEQANWFAAYNFDPKPYDGTVVLFRCQAPLPTDPPDSTHVWQRQATKVIVHDIPGDHNSILVDPGARVLAELIKSSMDAATLRSARSIK